MTVAKDETRTITRHVMFFKRLPHDLDTDTPTPTPDHAAPAMAEVMTPPPTLPMPEQVGHEDLDRSREMICHQQLFQRKEREHRNPPMSVEDLREKGEHQYVLEMRTLSTMVVKKLEP